MSRELKAYLYRDHEESFCSSIIYHFTSKDAKKLGVSKIGYEGDFLDIQCHRYKDGNKFVAEATEPGIERDDKKLRLMGWSYEDENSCATCGLAPMGMEKFSLCGECDQCPDCGHHDDCPELLGGGE